MTIDETFPAAHAITHPPAPTAATQLAASTAATLPESTHTMGPNHAGHAAAPPAATAHNAVAHGAGGAEAHPDSVSRNLTPAVAIVVAVDWGPLRMALSVAIADCAGAMRFANALLAMAAMILRLARMYAQVVYIHGPSSYSFHSGTPSTYRMARML